MVDKIEVFISYAQEDEGLRKELETQLGTLERRGLITIWHNRKVSAGTDFKQEISRHWNAARMILLLISPAFMASDYPYGPEIKRALERHNAGEARVIPILLRPTLYEGAPFDHLETLPANRKPITSPSWHNRDEAFFDVVEGIQGVVEELLGRPPASVLSSSEMRGSNPHKEKRMPPQPTAQEKKEFDVFLCHNSVDKSEVKKIAEQLKAKGVKPWLDEWELRPGLPWQRTLEEQIGQITSAAVFVGKDGVGPWQHMELDAFLREFVGRGCPVIPVLLQDAPEKPLLPPFLRAMTWVDFRKLDPDPLGQLVWGITGEKADGCQYVQGQASDPASVSPAMPTGLTPRKRHDLEERRDILLEERKVRVERLKRVRKAWTIEMNPAIKFQQEMQIQEDETALTRLDAELDEIDHMLR